MNVQRHTRLHVPLHKEKGKTVTYLSSPGVQAAIVLGAAIVLILLLLWLVAHFAYKDGHNDGRAYERNRANQRRLEGARVPTRLLQQAPAAWEVHQYDRHAPWDRRLTVHTATVAFAGGPATVPIAHNGRTPSGELRALVHGTDVFIENMRRDESAWRGQLANR